ncbi:Remorin family protein isoform 2 [Hibiscus syriacus]|uniref:Remorin family protein isoform 2 n=1 Tax=Hibiscus syriacus TaxID=106335 RepID=A0A6A3BJW7_HIBSY|nr:Remorin family protein isoform 2 [Hibiscus syriacus]
MKEEIRMRVQVEQIQIQIQRKLSRSISPVVSPEKEKSVADPPEDDNQLIDSARNSFSVALKDRRTRSEALMKNHHRRRQASLDLNNVSVSSPPLGAVKKSSVATRKSGSFPSPGAPNHHHASSAGMQNGWSSEHVSLHNDGGRRQGNVAAALPFNSVRTLPSKWEDAERWIFSPVSGDFGVKQSIAPPLRTNIKEWFSFLTGVIAADGLSIHSRSHGGRFAVRTVPSIARSVSVHGCFEVVNAPSFYSQDGLYLHSPNLPLLFIKDADENLDSVKDAATDISRTVSRRDMATQMSPQYSMHLSPKESPSFSRSNSSALPIILQSIHSSKPEVKDVQVDERVTMALWAKKQRARKTAKSSEILGCDRDSKNHFQGQKRRSQNHFVGKPAEGKS